MALARPVSRRTALQLPLALAIFALPHEAVATIPDDIALLGVLGNLVIPPTATQGAGNPDVVAFVARALAHGLDDTTPAMLATVRHALDAGAGGDFAGAGAPVQAHALTALDSASYGAPSAHAAAWRKVKGLILAGYYTSEAGCTKELTYDLAPGRWDNDLALKPGDRAIANDWFAVSFR